MKIWKRMLTGLMAICLLVLTPSSSIFAEEDIEIQEQETEEAIPESYYYEIESNNIEGWPQGAQIEAASAVVMDLDTGVILYSKQATETQYPASITKIMTTLLLIENCDLDDTITFSEIVYDIEEGSTHLGIQPGEEMTLRDAAYGIMLASANDIANGVAEYIGGSISGFADMMNQKAEELGCVNTHFSNPHGLYSDDHYTCAYDMALIAQAAYENETFREIISTTEYMIAETNLTEEARYFLNHHKMLQSDSEYYQEWCVGGKTGYTSQCLNTLVTYGSKDGMNLVSVILRVNGSDKAYEESTEILEYGFDNFSTKIDQKSTSSLTFYDIMGIRYVGKAKNFLSSVWMREPIENCTIQITLPDNFQQENLTCTMSDGSDGITVFSYEYSGYEVGTASGKFHTLFAPVQLAFEGSPNSLTEETSQAGSIQIESLDEVLTQTVEFLNEGYRIANDYAEDHSITVVAVGAAVLIFLIVFFVILIFRYSSDRRIRRKRRLEEEQRRRREDEIEQMTTAEIEAELRAVMEQERLRREKEEQARAEAERAAREAEEMERKARETEILLDELERERQMRLSKDKGINN